ncbi:serine hydrolase [Actinotalea sp. JY-7876]|uniref:serine hydrolase domain-containing protein n=1 Tax=Actinotalea sp. JY-7876 TaxID=2758442 RepID=UPI0015F44A48|nr:serine hydrolase domain-containing protein [Actinotalea sp. JY-7876]
MPPADASTLGPTLHARALTSGFSGVVRVDLGDELVFTEAYGLADRAHGIAATPEHRFGVASIAKGFTALTLGALLDEGRLTLETPVRPVLGTDLPLVDDRVTVGHLLAHTSGIGDYLDESGDGEITDYVLPVPTHRLDDAEGYLAVLDGRPQVSEPGAQFAYNNSGYVLLALLAQRITGTPFATLVHERVLAPAGLLRTGFPRSDEPAADVAVGYLDEDGPRTNVLHLPVRGSGDGGLVTTAGDLAAFWRAVFAGRVVSPGTLAALVEPVSDVPDEGMRYGRGFWLEPDSRDVVLEGYDAGVSARTRHDPTTGLTVTVLANTSDGAWPVLREDAD